MTAKWWMAAAAATLVACSGGNNGANNGTNNGSNNGTNNGTTQVDNSGAEYAEEYELKFDTLEFLNPPAKALNGIVANSLKESEEFPIIVLIELTDFDFDANTAVLQGGSGLKTDTDGVFVFDQDSDPGTTTTSFDAETGAFAGELEFFGFIATFRAEDMVSKSVLPIEQLKIEGKLALDEGGETATVVDGYMEGYITKENGDEVELQLIAGQPARSLTDIFQESSLNYDTTTSSQVAAGEGDAWFVTGNYTAKSVEIDD